MLVGAYKDTFVQQSADQKMQVDAYWHYNLVDDGNGFQKLRN